METLSMKHDVSFLLEELIPHELSYFPHQNIEHPYIDFDKFSSNKIQSQQYIIHRDNYIKFISELGPFARNQVVSI